jgi:hypothetical protein
MGVQAVCGRLRGWSKQRDEKTYPQIQSRPAGLPQHRRSSGRKANRALYRHWPDLAAERHDAVPDQEHNQRTAGTRKRAEAGSSASEEKLGLNTITTTSDDSPNRGARPNRVDTRLSSPSGATAATARAAAATGSRSRTRRIRQSSAQC